MSERNGVANTVSVQETLDGHPGPVSRLAVRLEVPAKPEFLALARLVTTAAADLDPSFADDRVDDLRLAVSEAATNAMEAHREIGQEHPVVLQCQLDDEGIRVEITDRARGFDPAGLPELPDVTDPRRLHHERGLGLALIKGVTDDFALTTGAVGTSVRFLVRSRPIRTDLLGVEADLPGAGVDEDRTDDPD